MNFESITNSIALVAKADTRSDYLAKALVNITCAGKVTRLDLHHILTYIFDPMAEEAIDAKDAIANIARTYGEMDQSAAFGNNEYPLVLIRRGDEVGLSGWECYSVLSTDTPERAEVKREIQKPSIESHYAEIRG